MLTRRNVTAGIRAWGLRPLVGGHTYLGEKTLNLGVIHSFAQLTNISRVGTRCQALGIGGELRAQAGSAHMDCEVCYRPPDLEKYCMGLCLVL